ncbi:methyl-accepting chemotaxis protein [Neptuniibacter halophilus]|uniref:methyl-accepting chemotaxis protein n=1 Tax=Neptuniibacter halophilus TaxID=651666 RepID=UPI002572807C|nr:methyl-accepting chemotaxis protein [Neptuniibacter halophilus]
MKINPWQSIRFKLSITMVMLTLSMLFVAGSGNLLISNLRTGVDTFGSNYLPAISAILNADRDLYQAREAELSFLLGNTSDDIRKDYEDNAQQALDRMNKYKELMADHPDVLSQLQQFDNTFKDWKSKADRVFELYSSNQRDAAMTQSQGEALAAFQRLRNLYDLAGEFLDQQAATDRDQLAEEIASFSLTITVFILVVLVVAGFLTYISPKMLVNSINQLTGRVQEISQGDGDLTLRINSSRKDELGALGEAFDQFIENLEQLISATRRQAEQLNEDSNLLEASANSSTDIVHQQSHSTEMIAAAVNQFSTAIRQVAENAQQAAGFSDNTVAISHDGQRVINDSVNKIMQLSDSVNQAQSVIQDLEVESDNISTVLDVIRGIADQTNLLALNAAIEAARAGDHGRGFAVVSDEVRSLASKTQDSTEEIQKMIEKLQSGVKQAVNCIQEGTVQVTGSVELVNSTQDLLNNIEQSAVQLNDMAIQIATATEEQSQVTDEINQNLNSLNDQNQHVQEVSRDTLSTVNDFRTTVNSLSGQLNRFKVGA